MELHRIKVVVHFPTAGATLRSKQLRVQIENTSEADARAVIVSRLVLNLPDVDLRRPQTIEVEMPYTGQDAGLTVSAFVAADVSRPPAMNDFITTVAVAVRANQAAHVNLVVYH